MTESQLLYLEPDDEITTVVRRLRESDVGARVVLVAPGRSKLTTSAVALRLLAGVAEEEGRVIALVAEQSGRALAAEAKIPAFATVAEANAEDAVPLEAPAVPRAPIHVVRGETPPPPREPEVTPRPAPQARSGPSDETMAVPVSPVVSPPPTPRRRRVPAPSPLADGRRLARRLPRVGVAAAVILVLLAGALVAAVAPSATVVIEPSAVDLDPLTYTLTLPVDGTDSGEVTAEQVGTATGTFSDPSPATGSVTIYNYTYVTIEVPQGTPVSASGEIFFTTTERVIAPPGDLVGLGQIQPGQVVVGVVAQEPGPAGNVEAGAINRVENELIDSRLQGFRGQTGRRVANAEPTTGGSENEEPEVVQADVDAVITALQGDLAQQLAERLPEEASRVYGPVDAGEPVVDVPADLVGQRGEETFTLSGRMSYERPYLERASVEEAARQRFLGDPEAAPEGTEILPDSMEVEVGDVSVSGDLLSVSVTITADGARVIDEDEIRSRIRGMTGPEAVEVLTPLGDVSVRLWPDWVEQVPQLTWRIEVRVEAAPAPGASAGASAGATP